MTGLPPPPEKFNRLDVAEAAGFSVELCPLCDGDVLLTKDDVIEHLTSRHSAVSLAVYIALIMFLSDDKASTDTNGAGE